TRALTLSRRLSALRKTSSLAPNDWRSMIRAPHSSRILGRSITGTTNGNALVRDLRRGVAPAVAAGGNATASPDTRIPTTGQDGWRAWAEPAVPRRTSVA